MNRVSTKPGAVHTVVVLHVRQTFVKDDAVVSYVHLHGEHGP